MGNGPVLRSLGNSELGVCPGRTLGEYSCVESGKSYPFHLILYPHPPQHSSSHTPPRGSTLISVSVLEMSSVCDVRFGFWRFQCRCSGSTATGTLARESVLSVFMIASHGASASWQQNMQLQSAADCHIDTVIHVRPHPLCCSGGPLPFCVAYNSCAILFHFVPFIIFPPFPGNS